MPTVTIAEVKGPEEGGKKGKIWDITGDSWGVWADDVKLFKPGNKYTFDQKPNPWKGVMKFDVIGRTVKQVGRDEDPRQTEMPVVTNGKARQQSYGGKSPMEQRQIFCSALLKSYIEAKLLPLSQDELNMAISIISEAYDRHFGEGEEGPP